MTASVLAVVGAILFTVYAGWRHGGGFLAGGAVSCLGLYATQWYVRRVSGEKPKNPRPVVTAIRYLLMAAALYAILKFLRLDLSAVLAGLFVAAAAAILEILFELIRAWNTK